MWELVKAVYTDAISVFLAQRCLYVFIFLYLTGCVKGGETKHKWDKHSLSYLFDFMYLFGVMSL